MATKQDTLSIKRFIKSELERISKNPTTCLRLAVEGDAGSQRFMAGYIRAPAQWSDNIDQVTGLYTTPNIALSLFSTSDTSESAYLSPAYPGCVLVRGYVDGTGKLVLFNDVAFYGSATGPFSRMKLVTTDLVPDAESAGCLMTGCVAVPLMDDPDCVASTVFDDGSKMQNIPQAIAKMLVPEDMPFILNYEFLSNRDIIFPQAERYRVRFSGHSVYRTVTENRLLRGGNCCQVVLGTPSEVRHGPVADPGVRVATIPGAFSEFPFLGSDPTTAYRSADARFQMSIVVCCSDVSGPGVSRGTGELATKRVAAMAGHIRNFLVARQAHILSKYSIQGMTVVGPDRTARHPTMPDVSVATLQVVFDYRYSIADGTYKGTVS